MAALAIPSLTYDRIGESTVYAVSLCNKLVLTVRKYTSEAEINITEEDEYLMSLGYLGAHNRGVVFLLSTDGYITVKLYNLISKNRKCKLYKQFSKQASVDNLFNQFEYDVYNSPYLKDIDFDSRSCGEFISKDFSVLPEKPRESDIKQFIEMRAHLSYTDKLDQQVGRRRDPIEMVITLLHSWSKYVEKKIDERNSMNIIALRCKKRHSNEKLFSVIEDNRTDEDLYAEAEIELRKIKEILASGNVPQYMLDKIHDRLPKIKAILNKGEDIAFDIEDAVDAAEIYPVDLGFSEFDGIGNG